MATFATNRNAYEQLKMYADAGTFAILLLKNTLTPLRTHNVVADVVGHECTAPGYSRQTLTGVTVTEDDVNDRGKLDANDPTAQVLGAGEILRHVVVYRPVTNDSDSPFLYFLDMGSDRTTDGNAFPIPFGPSGIARNQT